VRSHATANGAADPASPREVGARYLAKSVVRLQRVTTRGTPEDSTGSHLSYILGKMSANFVGNVEAVMFDSGDHVDLGGQADELVEALETQVREAHENAGRLPTL